MQPDLQRDYSRGSFSYFFFLAYSQFNDTVGLEHIYTLSFAKGILRNNRKIIEKSFNGSIADITKPNQTRSKSD